jgi:hypothetical protein
VKDWAFVHVPRTGGTTIASQLGVSDGHTPADAFDSKYVLGMVRNPYDRAVSICAAHLGYEKGDRILSVEAFEAWVRDGMIADVGAGWHDRRCSEWRHMLGTVVRGAAVLLCHPTNGILLGPIRGIPGGYARYLVDIRRRSYRTTPGTLTGFEPTRMATLLP